MDDYVCSLAATVMNMEKFAFDIQLERLDYSGSFEEGKNHILQSSEGLCDLLTGIDKEIVLQIKLPS